MPLTRRGRFYKRVYGYHGTSTEAAAEILHHGFRASRNDYDWLGDGIYFWQDAPSRAREWARKHYGDAATVIGARLTLSPSCMDLLDIEWWWRLEPRLISRSRSTIVRSADGSATVSGASAVGSAASSTDPQIDTSRSAA